MEVAPLVISGRKMRTMRRIDVVDDIVCFLASLFLDRKHLGQQGLVASANQKKKTRASLTLGRTLAEMVVAGVAEGVGQNV